MSRILRPMSHLARVAKSSSNWTSHDLEAYNIIVKKKTARAFFGQGLPDRVEGIDPEFLNATGPTFDHIANKNTRRLLMQLDLAASANANQISAITDFSMGLLRMLNFEERDHILRSCHAIPLHICEDQTAQTAEKAHTSISLVHHASTMLLIIQENKTLYSGSDPEPRLIAAAIAAFQSNNNKRGMFGDQEKDSMLIPCLTMIGTLPTFYIIPITKQLSESVEMGEYPEQMTQVQKCGIGGGSWGMVNPGFRLEALKHYILFRSLAKGLWSEYLT